MTSRTCVTHVKNIRRHYGGQLEISVSRNPLGKIEAGKRSFDTMVNFCTVLTVLQGKKKNHTFAFQELFQIMEKKV